jgi:hypothetical protein
VDTEIKFIEECQLCSRIVRADTSGLLDTNTLTDGLDEALRLAQKLLDRLLLEIGVSCHRFVIQSDTCA